MPTNQTRDEASYPEQRGRRPTVLYVGGIGRSGSTVLGGALGQRPGHMGVGEVMRFFERGLVRNEPCSCGRSSHGCDFWGPLVAAFRGELLDGAGQPSALVRELSRITEGWRAPAALIRPSGASDRILGLMTELYERISEQAGSRILVDTSKNPVWLKLLLELPGIDVHVVHLVRDSRGVAQSFRKRRTRNGLEDEDVYMYRHPALVTAVGWNVVNLLVRRIGSEARSYRLVRHEDFVEAPHGVLQRCTVGRADREEEVDGEVRRSASADGEGAGDTLAIDFREQHVVAGNPVRLERPLVRVSPDGRPGEGLPALSRAAVTLMNAPGLARYGYLRTPN